MKKNENILNASHASIDHIAIAVKSIENALQIYSLLGGIPCEREIVADQGVEVLPINFAGARIELLQALNEETPVGRYINKNGEGLHHIAIKVKDLNWSIEESVKAGFKVLNSYPRKGAEGRMVAFLDPKTTGGVLIELTQLAE